MKMKMPMQIFKDEDEDEGPLFKGAQCKTPHGKKLEG